MADIPNCKMTGFKMTPPITGIFTWHKHMFFPYFHNDTLCKANYTVEHGRVARDRQNVPQKKGKQLHLSGSKNITLDKYHA